MRAAARHVAVHVAAWWEERIRRLTPDLDSTSLPDFDILLVYLSFFCIGAHTDLDAADGCLAGR